MKTRIRTTKFQQAAKNEPCALKIYRCCNHNPETTVLAHTGRHGTAKRNHHEDSVFACSNCHDAIDRRTGRFMSNDSQEQHNLNQERIIYIKTGERITRARFRELGLIEQEQTK